MSLQNTGWWTYKFCYGVQLAQFHRESIVATHSDDKTAHGTPQVGSCLLSFVRLFRSSRPPSLILDAINQVCARVRNGQRGFQTAASSLWFEENHPRPRMQGALSLWTGSRSPPCSLSQWFEGGTGCDIMNGKPRRTEVRYYCDPNEGQALRTIKVRHVGPTSFDCFPGNLHM